MLCAVEPGLDPFNTFSIEILLLGIAVLAAVGALSLEHEQPFSAAMVYVGIGVAGAVGIAAFDVNWLDPMADAGVIRHIAELALIVALFEAGLTLEEPLRSRWWRTPALLLAIGMTLTVAAVAAFGALAMGLSLAAAIALGAILAPTDPVLAGGIGTEPSWERGEREKSRARFTLTAEAAANDWLASPIALVAVFVATEGGTGWLDEWALFDVLYAILAAAAIGALVGYGIARLAFGMRDHKMLAGELSGFIVIGAVLLTFGFAEALDSYGFLAVLAAGMSFRRYEMDHEYNERIHRGAVVARNFTELIVILLLGSLVTTELLSAPGLAGWLLVGVLLFVIRPVSTLIATIGSPLDRRERTLVAWFGVRGVAAVYYVALLIEEHAIVGSEASAVLWTTVAVVLVSILVHGASAAPLERRLLQ